MPRHALSAKLKSQAESRANEYAVQQAADAYRAYEARIEEEGLKEGEKKLGVASFARDFGVSATTLGRRLDGKRSQAEYLQTRQKLSPDIETQLVNYIVELAANALPPTKAQIREVAQKLLPPDAEPLGIHWVDNFIDRNDRKLSKFKAKYLETARADNLNAANVKAHEDLVEARIKIPGVTPDCIYGMDETAINQGDRNAPTEVVVAGSGTKSAMKRGLPQSENITLVECICANGMALKPMIIFTTKGEKERVPSTWLQGENPADARYGRIIYSKD